MVKGFEEKARFILFARDLNRPYKHAQEVHIFFIEACHAAGINDHDRLRVYLPTINLVGVYDGLHSSLMPTQQEFKEAFYLGAVPAFVRLYELTGEIVLPDSKALDRLNEIKRNGGTQ